MDYGLIGKLEKAKRYAEDRRRFRFSNFELTFHGDNRDYKVSYNRGYFSCECDFFLTHQRCAHTMALETLLHEMVPEIGEAEPVLMTEAEREFAQYANKYSVDLINTKRRRGTIQKSSVPQQLETPLSHLPRDESPPAAKKKTERPEEVKKHAKSRETQEFSIESELSTYTLQDALAPYLEALTELQHIIDELKGNQASHVKILGINSHD